MTEERTLVQYTVSIPYVLRLIGRKTPQSADSFVRQMERELAHRLAGHDVTIEIHTNHLTAHTVDVQLRPDTRSTLHPAATTAWDDAVHSVILNHWL